MFEPHTYLYVMASKCGWVKIGITTTPLRRMRANSAFGIKFEVVGLWRTADCMGVEKTALRLVKTKPILGREWFHVPVGKAMNAARKALVLREGEMFRPNLAKLVRDYDDATIQGIDSRMEMRREQRAAKKEARDAEPV